jgi:hypothetical protein
MGNNISHAFYHVFSNKHINRTPSELCELIEKNIDYTVSLGQNVCHFMFYEHYYSDGCIEKCKELLKDRGINLEDCVEYPNRKNGEKMLIITII